MTGRAALPRVVWLVIALVWGVFLAAMYLADMLKFFQASPYLYFTGAAGVLLAALALKGVFLPSRHTCACGHVHEGDAPCPREQDHVNAGHPHAPGKAYGRDRDAVEPAPPDAAIAGAAPSWWATVRGIALLVMLVAPVVLALLVPHRSLNALAAIKRGGTGLDSSQLLDVYRTRQRQWQAAGKHYQRVTTLEALEIGRDAPDAAVKVRVVGLAYRSDKTPEDMLSILRFKITCCAADAVPVSVAVRTEKAGEFRNDTWVEVRGVVERQSIEGRETTVIVVDPAARPEDAIAEVAPPERPYI